MTAPRKDESVPTVPVTPVAPVVPVVPVVQEPVEPRRKLWQALFFTKDGRLDTMQLMLGICCVVGLSVFVGQALGQIPTGRPDKEAWAWFGAFTAVALGSGAWTNGKALMGKGGIVNAVTQVVADRRAKGRSLRPSTEPDLFTDDESA